MAFLIDEKLFPGDSLGWELAQNQLWTNPIFCWDDWPMQARALRRLQAFRFDYVCSGHNYSIGFPIPGPWAEVFNSDVYDNFVNPVVAGNGGGVTASGPPMHGFPASASIVIPANGFVVFART